MYLFLSVSRKNYSFSSILHLGGIFTACNEPWKVLFLALSVCGCLIAYEIPQELLNGFAPNSHGSRVWYGLG